MIDIFLTTTSRCDLSPGRALQDFPLLLRSRIESYKHPLGRQESYLSYCYLEQVLSSRYHIDDALVYLRFSDKGKPVLTDLSEPLFVSISHSKQAIAIAVAPIDIGIDIEYARQLHSAMPQRLLDADSLTEYRQLSTAMQQSYLMRQWVVKESHLKLIGEGINTKLSCILVKDCGSSMYCVGKSTASHYVISDYHLAVASSAHCFGDAKILENYIC